MSNSGQLINLLSPFNGSTAPVKGNQIKSQVNSPEFLDTLTSPKVSLIPTNWQSRGSTLQEDLSLLKGANQGLPTSKKSSPSTEINGRKVLPIDPTVTTKQAANTLLSPKYSVPPIGSVLQTPPDPTRVKLGHGTLMSATNEFMQTLPPVHSVPIVQPLQATKPESTQSAPQSAPPQSAPPQSKPELTQEEKVKLAKKRADYAVKFSILREAYPKMNIPEPTEAQSIEEIEASYRQYVKKIHIDSSVEQNKTYLLIGWLLIELFGTAYMKWPVFKGYTFNQFKYLNQYQMLLIGLGEQSYAAGAGEGWPFEVRIATVMIFNAVIFAIVGMLAGKFGSDAMADKLRDMINNFMTNSKDENVLRRAEEATAENVPPAAPKGEASPPMGEFGSLLAQFAPLLGGLLGGNNANKTEQPAEIKQPTTFASRNRRNQKPATDPTTVNA